MFNKETAKVTFLNDACSSDDQPMMPKQIKHK